MVRTLGFLALLLIIVAGIGFYKGWFSLTTTRDDGNQVNINLTVNKDKLKEDVSRARDKAREIAARAAEGTPKTPAPTDQQTITGRINRVETDSQRLVVSIGIVSVPFQLNPATRVRVNNRDGRVADLRPGDQAAVTFKVENGKNAATTVAVSRT